MKIMVEAELNLDEEINYDSLLYDYEPEEINEILSTVIKEKLHDMYEQQMMEYEHYIALCNSLRQTKKEVMMEYERHMAYCNRLCRIDRWLK